MFGIGIPEVIVILIIALVVIGPEKLPEIASALGKGYGEFQRALKGMRDAVDEIDIDRDTVHTSGNDFASPDAERKKEEKENGN